MGRSSSRMACSDRCRCLECRNGHGKGVSTGTKRKLVAFMESEKGLSDVARLRSLLSPISRDEDILMVYYENGFNMLQKCVAENNLEALKLILARDPDLNSGPCSYPLHIACLNGYSECVQELIQHGARLDVEARMCWPGPHSENCRGTKNESKKFHRETKSAERAEVDVAGRDKCQNALYYAVDGDQSNLLGFLLEIQDMELQTTTRHRPMLEVACERQAWSCCNVLIENRSEEINLCYLRSATHEKPNTVQMTLFHVLFLMVRKSADFVLRTCELLLDNGLRSEINSADSMGNTPLHGLIVRYAFEEMRQPWLHEYAPWRQEEMKTLVQFLLRNGASESINLPGNSVLSHVVRHINDWGFCYDLLDVLLQDGGDPNVKGRDGNFPLMVCLTPLINNDPFMKFTEATKVCYMNCIEILCLYGADPNCVTLSKLTPLHILVFTASENLSVLEDEAKAVNFAFVKDILIMLFQFGLDPNVGIADRAPNVFHGIVEMVKNSRSALDMDQVYELILTLIQYGVDPNVEIEINGFVSSYYGQENPFLVTEHSHVLGYIFFILAKKEHILSDPGLSFARVLYLFYYCMEHGELFKCLRSLFAQLSAIPPDSPCQGLCDIISGMCTMPRTLKQIARVAVHRVIDRRPGLVAEMLPIPQKLQNYLRDFEP